MFMNMYKALTGTVDGAEGRAQRVCVPLRRCTPPGREGGNGWDWTAGENRTKNYQLRKVLTIVNL